MSKKKPVVKPVEPRKAPNEIKPIDVWPDGMFHISNEYTRHCLAGYYCSGGDTCAFGEFKGHVSKITSDAIIFNRLFIRYDERMDIIDGKEDHVWIYDKQPFLNAGIKAGDCVRFTALAAMYRRQNGTFDFGLKAPQDIEKIDGYDLPSDDALALQAASRFVCETCMYGDHCDGVYCLMDDAAHDMLVNKLAGL